MAVSSIPPVNPAIMHDLIMYGLAIGAMGIGFEVLKALRREKGRKQRKKYYNEEYLQSEEWERKRQMVFKRDNWTCVYCGHRATQVHHKRYARRNIGKEPIEWLVSTCKQCHEKQHV